MGVANTDEVEALVEAIQDDITDFQLRMDQSKVIYDALLFLKRELTWFGADNDKTKSDAGTSSFDTFDRNSLRLRAVCCQNF